MTYINYYDIIKNVNKINGGKNLERLDKIIASQGKYSRKEVKKLVSSRRISIDGKKVTSSDIKIDFENVKIEIDGAELKVRTNIYLILNKPKGYVSATEDKKDKTVLELVPKELFYKDLFPAGRLDKDTTGLMIITNDGEFAHNILSPKKHIPKTYKVRIDIKVTTDMVKGFEEGIKLNDGVCKASKLEILGENEAKVTLTEGRYHQIKRMFGCFGAKVIELHRLSMGNLKLPKDLEYGECRELTKEELKKLQERNIK